MAYFDASWTSNQNKISLSRWVIGTSKQKKFVWIFLQVNSQKTLGKSFVFTFLKPFGVGMNRRRETPLAPFSIVVMLDTNSSFEWAKSSREAWWCKRKKCSKRLFCIHSFYSRRQKMQSKGTKENDNEALQDIMGEAEIFQKSLYTTIKVWYWFRYTFFWIFHPKIQQILCFWDLKGYFLIFFFLYFRIQITSPLSNHVWNSTEHHRVLEALSSRRNETSKLSPTETRKTRNGGHTYQLPCCALFLEEGLKEKSITLLWHKRGAHFDDINGILEFVSIVLAFFLSLLFFKILDFEDEQFFGIFVISTVIINWIEGMFFFVKIA